MKIKTKLIIAFLGIALISIFVSSYIVVKTINNRYIKIEQEKIAQEKKQGEIEFYDQLSVLKRKALIMASFQEISNYVNNKEELYLLISSRAFLVDNINVRILSPDKNTIFMFRNSESIPIKENVLKNISFLSDNSEQYIRKAGIFYFNGGVYYIIMSPIVNQENFEILGYMLLEKKVNMTFANYLKEKMRLDIIVLSKDGKRMVSTIIDNNGKQYFFEDNDYPVDKAMEVEINSEKYYMKGFEIKDYFGNSIGKLFFLDNIGNMLVAQKLFYKNFFLILLSLSLFLIIIGFFLARKISTPILNLSNATKELSHGNFDIRVNKTSNDEIGELTEIFNDMVVSFRLQKNKILGLQKFSESIIENLTLALIIFDEKFNINTINNQAEQLFKISKSSDIGKNLFTSVPFFNKFVDDILKLSYEDTPKYYDNIEYKDKSGNNKIIRLIIYKIFVDNKKYIVLQAEDITKRIRIEEKLTQANKLISVGELLGKFTHENSNIVSGILGNIEILKMRMKESDKKERLFKIEKLVKKSLELSDSILDFSRKRKLIIKKITVREKVNEVVELLKTTVLKNIEVIREFPHKIYLVKANEEKLSVIIMNLLINAKDTIEETKRKDGKIRVKIYVNKEADKDYLVLSVKDNGMGIKEEDIKKIFNSYYTTKGEKGTGLGLANVKDIVEEFGGFIKVDSIIDKGTTFLINFPIIEELVI
jgi:two-component system NtrC family sensor kinase